MMSFNRLPIFLLVLLLTILSASLVFAEAEQTTEAYAATPGQILPLNSAPVAGLANITSEYAQGIRMDFGSQTLPLVAREISLDPRTDIPAPSSHEPFVFSFYQSNEARLGISPMTQRFSFNPITDIMNLEVLVQYKF